MDLIRRINPLREDGGLDQRFSGIVNQIIEKTGQPALSLLEEFYCKSSELEKEYGGAALRLVKCCFSVQAEQWQRRALKKQLTEFLKELGFKPSKVSKLIAAGEFYASESRLSSDKDLILDERSENKRRQDHKEKCEYLDGYSVSSLYLLSRMDWKGIVSAQNIFYGTGVHPTTKELEKLGKRYPKKDERWNYGRAPVKRASAGDDLSPSAESVHQEFEAVPVVCDVYEVTPSVDRVQEGVRMLINSLSLIGSIDELAMNHECLEQLRPHFMTLEMLASVAASSPCPPRKTYC
mgnify:CR=1 FL=1